MKKTDKAARKLTLNRETVRSLENGELSKIQGGGSVWWTACVSECTGSCMPE